MRVFLCLFACLVESVRFHENSVSKLYELNTFYIYCFMRFGVNHSRELIEMEEIEDLCGGLLADRIRHQSKGRLKGALKSFQQSYHHGATSNFGFIGNFLK
ncbi:Oidioi.mRNA.OKI2018_I69.PAR.g8798.t1.cds [Oikopleura dioica]|uniref:Oidioi.mRNA.OKI2018_I69.PAR.g8798.t1.cds n=1 Tax=Oikopleura dioica TaxID=34765 RepID=A0ABN7RHL9_OIKDI|nr:Oidioi.mRNA.OKI2018_I69.PAR.g8798.t1.cds [Oikopleura dioica]